MNNLFLVVDIEKARWSSTFQDCVVAVGFREAIEEMVNENPNYRLYAPIESLPTLETINGDT